MALAWETLCDEHKGMFVPFSQDSKDNDIEPFELVWDKDEAGSDQDVQGIIDRMIAEVGPGANSNINQWYYGLRTCNLEGEGCHSVPKTALGKLAILHRGPCHLILHSQHKKGGHSKHRGRIGVRPSLGVRVFGRSYTLCGVVYYTGGGFHFVSQVYFPTSRCWVICDDVRDSEGVCGTEFDADYKKGEAYMFLYVSNDVLIDLGCVSDDSGGRKRAWRVRIS